MNAEHYCSVLEQALLLLLDRHLANNLYQPDNALPHIANYTKQWQSDNNVDVIDWPARSPDLNPIENAWGELARALYANAWQYDFVDDLKESIQLEWDKLSMQYFRNLIRSMPKRTVKVVRRGGVSIGY